MLWKHWAVQDVNMHRGCRVEDGTSAKISVIVQLSYLHRYNYFNDYLPLLSDRGENVGWGKGW